MALMAQLARHHWNGIDRILLIDPRLPAAGVAFDRDEEYLLCNTSVAVNSIFPGEDPSDFLSWLRHDIAHTLRWGIDRGRVTEHSYVPRGLFHAYLATHFQMAVEDCAARGIFVDHIPDVATAVEQTPTGAVIRTATGDRFPVQRVVISTGLQRSQATTRRCMASDGLMWSAYDTHRNVDRLSRARRVLVLGMRQSAIDAVQMVHEYNPDAEVVMVSRSAQLPAVRSEMVEHHSSILTAASVRATSLPHLPGSVQRWQSLLRQELRLHREGGKLMPEAKRGTIRQLAADLEHTRHGNRAWQRIDRHAVTVANMVWGDLPETTKLSLRVWFDADVQRFVSAIPDRVAERLLDAAHSGSLVCTQVAGAPEFANDHVDVVTVDGAVRSDVAIDATGMTAYPLPIGPAETANAAGIGGPRFVRSVHRLGPSNVDAVAIPNYFNATARQAAELASALTQQTVKI